MPFTSPPCQIVIIRGITKDYEWNKSSFLECLHCQYTRYIITNAVASLFGCLFCIGFRRISDRSETTVDTRTTAPVKLTDFTILF